MTNPELAVQRVAREAFLDALVFDDPVQLYERAPCGFLSTTPDGLIVKCNATFRTWIGMDAGEVVGRLTFADLLAPGSRIFHETHWAPSLFMQGSVREIALDLVTSDGSRVPVLATATLDRDDAGEPVVIRIAVFDATERRRYERELVRAKDRAQESEALARALARTLQQTLVPPTLPKVAGLEVAAAYLPAGNGLDVGGDFYDVFPVAADEWVVVIGDVQGKGVEAAVVAGLVRHTVRAFAVDHEEPDAVLQRVNEVLLRHGVDRFSSAAIFRLSRRGQGWRLALGNGGHPQPVLVRRGSTPELFGDYGQLLGAFETMLVGVAELVLEPGDVVVLYTDGVTEARRGDEQFGEDRLLQAVGASTVSLEEMVRDVVEAAAAFGAGAVSDDVAIVGVRVPE